jgi:hypothetical protein
MKDAALQRWCSWTACIRSRKAIARSPG